MKANYRTDAQTKRDILQTCADHPSSLLSVVSRSSNLSHYQVGRHMEVLVKNKLIIVEEKYHDRAKEHFAIDKIGKFYSTTEDGLKAIKILNEVDKLVYGVGHE